MSGQRRQIWKDFEGWLSDLPIPIEVYETNGREVQFRNTALRNAFPKVAEDMSCPILDIAAKRQLPAAYIPTSKRAVDMFCSWDGMDTPKWTPDFSTYQDRLASSETAGNLHRFYQFEKVKVDNDRLTIVMLENQSRHWKAEKELEVGVQAANGLFEMLEPQLDGLAYRSRAMDRVSGDFIFGDEILNNKRRANLFVVGDCSGHGVDAAVVRMLLITHLEAQISRYVSPGRKKLESSNASNPFYRGRKRKDFQPAAHVLKSMHEKLESTLFRAELATSILGFDGVVVYAEDVGEKTEVHVALSKFDIFHVRIADGKVTDIEMYEGRRRRSTDGKNENDIFKGAGGQKGASILSDPFSFEMAPGDLLFTASDGLRLHLQDESAEFPKGLKDREVDTFLRYLVQKTGPDPRRLSDKVMKMLVNSRRELEIWLDDVIVAFFNSHQSFHKKD